MNSTQIALLAALNSAEFFKDSPVAKLFHEFAMGIYKNLKFQYVVTPLIENGYVSGNGTLTKKGRLSLVHDPRELSNLQLSINTRFHLVESIHREILTTSSKTGEEVKGTLSFLSMDQFNKLGEAWFHELSQRKEDPNYGVTEDLAYYLTEYGDTPSQNINPPSEVVTSEVVDISSLIPEEPKKKSKKVKV